MEIMEVREELEEVKEDQTRLSQLRLKNQQQVGALYVELTDAFRSAQLERARALTARLQYLQRIEDEIHTRSGPA